MFVFYILLDIFEEKNRRKWYSSFMPPMKDDDIAESEVMEEKKRVEEYMKCKKDNTKIKIICIYITYAKAYKFIEYVDFF